MDMVVYVRPEYRQPGSAAFIKRLKLPEGIQPDPGIIGIQLPDQLFFHKALHLKMMFYS
jgi:hypothetical protein